MVTVYNKLKQLRFFIIQTLYFIDYFKQHIIFTKQHMSTIQNLPSTSRTTNVSTQLRLSIMESWDNKLIQIVIIIYREYLKK